VVREGRGAGGGVEKKWRRKGMERGSEREEE
jgi:hypothetical protein